MISQQKFPKDFLWGASTSSHQVEGGTVNQWSRWELEQATKLAAGAEKHIGWLAVWKDIQPAAEDPDNYVSGRGVEHYERYEEDFDLLQKLQLNSFRFGIEWSRVQPEEGAFNLEAIKHYHDYIDSLNRRGITPILNIWHWTEPVWFADKGGFAKKENLAYFDTYVQKLAEEFADKVQYFITVNEPNVYSSTSYLFGIWPPQQKSLWTTFRVYRHLAQAHNRAYSILKARRSTLMVGVAAQLMNIVPKRPFNIFDLMVAKAAGYGTNWWFLNRTRRHQDFIGINYYFTDYYKGLAFGHNDVEHKQWNEVAVPGIKRLNPSGPMSDINGYLDPSGLYPLMMETWRRYKKPIIITENGLADAKDQYRQWWIEETVLAMQRALSEGVELKGYVHWSLLDNFEWDLGWWPKFGLVEVDRQQDMKRTPRPSAIWFARYLKDLQGGEGPKKPTHQTQTSQAAKSSLAAANEAATPRPTRPTQSQAKTTPAKPVGQGRLKTRLKAPADRVLSMRRHRGKVQ